MKIVFVLVAVGWAVYILGALWRGLQNRPETHYLQRLGILTGTRPLELHERESEWKAKGGSVTNKERIAFRQRLYQDPIPESKRKNHEPNSPHDSDHERSGTNAEKVLQRKPCPYALGKSRRGKILNYPPARRARKSTSD